MSYGKHELEIIDDNGDVDVRVGFFLDGSLGEIKFYSRFLDDYIPVTESYLERLYPSRLERIYRKVRVEIQNIELELADDHPHGAA